jgi:hypothetical protein
MLPPSHHCRQLRRQRRAAHGGPSRKLSICGKCDAAWTVDLALGEQATHVFIETEARLL